MCKVDSHAFRLQHVETSFVCARARVVVSDDRNGLRTAAGLT